MASEDTEITLGVGRLVGLFFVLAAVCGVFFSIGYSLGKSTAREQALEEQPAQVLAASPGGTGSEQPGAKPAVEAAPNATEAEQRQPEQTSASNMQNNLTFYKAVQQGNSVKTPEKDSAPGATSAPAMPKTKSEPDAQNATPPAQTANASEAAPAGHAVPVTGAGTIVVQIAAITREDDAVALAGALRKKDYNVIVVKNPAINDKFYHVQVGPFANMKEADAMKTRLIAEGYNPIVKR